MPDEYERYPDLQDEFIEAELLGRVTRRFRDTDAFTVDPGERISQLVSEEAPLLAPDDRARMERRLSSDLLGLGDLEQLLEDSTVTDVLVNGPGEVWVERAGELCPTGIHLDESEIHRAIERLVAPLGLRCDRSHPVTHGRLANGTRVTAVLSPISVRGPALALRRHSSQVFPLESFTNAHTAGVLRGFVADRSNIVVYGRTGSGKTSLVNSLGRHVLPQERIVVIEDVAELRFDGPQVLNLETREGSTDGRGTVDLRDLVRTALRLRPDRLVLGEVRGPEAVEMLWALSSGHRGSMSTCHANDASGAVGRLETMVIMATGEALPLSAVRAQILDAVDVFVGVDRDSHGRRFVTEVTRSADLVRAATR